MSKINVLFVCIHNSARSQMAEAFLNAIPGDRFAAKSAGLEPGKLNPLVVTAMKEVSLDISGNKTKNIDKCTAKGKMYEYLITVCDEASAEKCPRITGEAKRLHWSFDDPSRLEGTDEEKLKQIRIVRDAIKARVENWVKEF